MMRELNKHDVERVRRLLPKEVREVMRKGPDRPFLAGGFIRAVICGEEPNDVDLFVKNDFNAAALVSVLACTIPGSWHLKTDNAYTVLGGRYPIQVIHRWTFDSPQQCVESFDFTIASAAMWPSGGQSNDPWMSFSDCTLYEDLAAKRLVYRNPVRNEDVGGSMLRLLKFSRMGYSGPLRTVADVMARLSSGVKPEKLSDRVPLADLYLGLLREVDPLRVGESDD